MKKSKYAFVKTVSQPESAQRPLDARIREMSAEDAWNETLKKYAENPAGATVQARAQHYINNDTKIFRDTFNLEHGRRGGRKTKSDRATAWRDFFRKEAIRLYHTDRKLRMQATEAYDNIVSLWLEEQDSRKKKGATAYIGFKPGPHSAERLIIKVRTEVRKGTLKL